MKMTKVAACILMLMPAFSAADQGPPALETSKEVTGPVTHPTGLITESADEKRIEYYKGKSICAVRPEAYMRGVNPNRIDTLHFSRDEVRKAAWMADCCVQQRSVGRDFVLTGIVFADYEFCLANKPDRDKGLL
ncbi:MAG: hypothetical protein JAY72_07980, partial [Candidatus Thiodiazotropha endolucinida]|nr:hypothetical protein [Candidatus Thiodiazotropha taylori]